jgi:threonine dehydrogenase-like Zn-dependent dehydrogenase
MEDYGTMVVASRPNPQPREGEVVIDVVATGICGSDIHGFTGDNGRRFPGQVMGHESVGRVSSLGIGVDSLQCAVGQVVTFNPLIVSASDRKDFAGREQHAPGRLVIGVAAERSAAFAQKVVVPAENVVVLPPEMPIAYGALVEPLAVALHSVRRAGVRRGDLVLVIGGGPIGQSVVLSALHEGAGRVYVSEPNSARRELCTRLGAVALDPSTAAIVEQLRAAEGRMADVSIDAVGVSATIEDALESTRFGGTICLVGMGARQLGIDAYRVSTEERTIVGSFCYSFDDFTAAATWIGDGDPLFGLLISDEIALTDGPEAFRRLAEGADVPGKVLVRFDS